VGVFRDGTVVRVVLFARTSLPGWTDHLG
jgi:hypothetical protein